MNTQKLNNNLFGCIIIFLGKNIVDRECQRNPITTTCISGERHPRSLEKQFIPLPTWESNQCIGCKAYIGREGPDYFVCQTSDQVDNTNLIQVAWLVQPDGNLNVKRDDVLPCGLTSRSMYKPTRQELWRTELYPPDQKPNFVIRAFHRLFGL